MKNYKKILFFIVVPIVIVLIVVLNQDKTPKDTRPMVAVSSFALYDIMQHIAGDTVKIVNILPFGVDPHSFEPTPKLMAEIEKSKIVFYSGAGLEPWTHGYSFHNVSVNMSKYVSLRKLGSDELAHHHNDTHAHHSTLDPHYWLDFTNMQKSANVITQELIKLEPKNELLYIKNEKKYLSMLDELTKEYAQSLQSCKLDTIVVNHNAFGYLSHKFGFHVESLSGLTPEAQPNAQNMSRLIQDIKKTGVGTVFVESFVSAKAMQSIANEAGVEVGVLQPLGNITGDEAKQHLSYETIMKKNLVKIHKALQCR